MTLPSASPSRSSPSSAARPIQALWPDTFVTDANLTNVIVTLRKILGRESIQTVSKFGYRFCLPVVGEPGIDEATYAMFLRAKALVAVRSIESVTEARDRLTVCVAAEPSFAAEPVSPLLGGLMSSLLAILEDRRADAAAIMGRIVVEHEPESTIYLARHYAMIDDPAHTVSTLRKARAGGLASSYAIEHDRAFRAVRRNKASAKKSTPRARSNATHARRWKTAASTTD